MDGVYGVYEVYEAYEVDDVDENGRSILKRPMVSSFCQGQSSFTQISQSFGETHNGQTSGETRRLSAVS